MRQCQWENCKWIKMWEGSEQPCMSLEGVREDGGVACLGVTRQAVMTVCHHLHL